MNSSPRCYLICGTDLYRSTKALKAIESRFLAKQESLVDFVKYDMQETNFETLKQTLLTVPFLVTHRLFVLKHVLGAPKSALEGLVPLLEQLSDSTIVVFYEAKACDKRLAFYSWLTRHAKIQEYVPPVEYKLAEWLSELAKEQGVTLERSAARLLADYVGSDTWRLALEIQKLACYAKSQKRMGITTGDVEELCEQTEEASLFKLTDALRDGDIKGALQLYRRFILKEDPMLLAGTVGSQIRTLAKIALCYRQGITQSADIARQSGLNPYVVKLALPLARTLPLFVLKQCYANLIQFDTQVKDGSVSGNLGILLLILRLHGNLKQAGR